ncbi:MAG: hypothetical protein RLZZ129_2013 [Verrucomicrobiota bacterium]|jgi:hypothetical protein
MRNSLFAIYIGLMSYGSCWGAEVAEVTRAPGGSIKTVLSRNIVLNSESSLAREWIAVHQPNYPAKLKGTPGVTTRYKSGGEYSRGEYQYHVSLKFWLYEAITAIEIRFLMFDIWGQHVKSLSLTEIRDFNPDLNKLSGAWRIFSENEASEYYASITYIARVRTRDGRIISADIAPVLAEARRLSEKFSESDLDPEKPESAN